MPSPTKIHVFGLGASFFDGRYTWEGSQWRLGGRSVEMALAIAKVMVDAAAGRRMPSDDLLRETPVLRLLAPVTDGAAGLEEEVAASHPLALALAAGPSEYEDLSAALELVEKVFQGEEICFATVDNGKLAKGEVMDSLTKVENSME